LRVKVALAEKSSAQLMLILMGHSAESVATSNVKACDLAGNGQRRGQWLERAGVRDALVRPVPVIELLELPQGMQEVGLVPDQGAVQQFAAAGLRPPFMIEFILGIWTPLSTTWMPASARMASNSPGTSRPGP